MYLVPNIHPGSGSAGVPTVTGNFAVPLSDFTTLDTTTAMPSGGSISRSGQAMLYDSTGKLTYAPNNLLTFSQQLDNGAWFKTASSISADATTAPDGTTTADKFVEDTANTSHIITSASVSHTAGVSYVVSAYIKPAGRDWTILSIPSSVISGGKNVWFNASSGTIGTTPSGVTASISNAGNGWYRCIIAFTADQTGSNRPLSIYSSTGNNVQSYTGDGTSGLFIWGAQLEAVTYQTTPSTYVATTTAAYYGPRFDYNPSTLAARGLLIEGTRTNIATYSEDFSNAAWEKSGTASIVADQTTSPSGTNTADIFRCGATASSECRKTNISYSSGTSYNFSAYAKKEASNYIILQIFDAATTSFIRQWFNLDTGVVETLTTGGTTVTFGSATISNVGSGWYRCSITGIVTAATTTGRISIFISDANGSFNGTATSGVYLWGAQVELGAFPSSYIPTVAASVSRAAETFAITGYSSNLIEAFYTDVATGGSWSANYNAGVAPSTSFGWTTSLRAYTNAYAGDITSPSWIDNSGTTGNRMYYDSTGALTWAPANLLLNTATLSTQTVTGGVAAGGDYILSFKGTGSVAISGGHTATLAGTGASNLVSLKFASTTASLTFTVTGSVTDAQLERVTYQTSPRAYIPTTTAAVYQPRYDFDPSTVPATARGMLIEESRANLLLQSQKLDTSWTTANGSIALTSEVAPDGSLSVYKNTPNTTSGIGHNTTQSVSLTSGTVYTLSAYFKAAGYKYCALFAGQVSQGKYFDLINGTVLGNLVGAPTSASITSVGNGWYRCSITITANATGSSTCALYPSSAGNDYTMAGDGVSGIYIWGAQLEASSFATSYISTVASSVTRVADVVKLSGSALTTMQGASASAIMEFGPVPNAWAPYILAGTTTNTTYMRVAGSTTLRNTANGVNLNATLPSGSFYGTTNNRGALAFSASGRSLVANNGTVATDANVNDVPTAVNVASLSSTYIINSVVRSLAFYNQRLPDAVLKTKSAVGAPY